MMSLKFYKKGITLVEILTVIAIAVLVTVVSVPAIDVFFDSFASQGSTQAMINAALSSARAMATSEHKYVGIRFQKIYDESPLYADQYMIFIVYDYEGTGRLANGFRAVDGLKPMKLPENIGVMDLYYGSDNDRQIDDDLVIGDFFRDATTFSIIFSPAGKLVIHDVWVRNRDGRTDDSSSDDIFNTEGAITAPVKPTGMFLQDAANELSRRMFYIYDTRDFRRAYNDDQPVSGYLVNLEPLYINPHTGTIISQE